MRSKRNSAVLEAVGKCGEVTAKCLAGLLEGWKKGDEVLKQRDSRKGER